MLRQFDYDRGSTLSTNNCSNYKQFGYLMNQMANNQFGNGNYREQFSFGNRNMPASPQQNQQDMLRFMELYHDLQEK